MLFGSAERSVEPNKKPRSCGEWGFGVELPPRTWGGGPTLRMVGAADGTYPHVHGEESGMYDTRGFVSGLPPRPWGREVRLH